VRDDTLLKFLPAAWQAACGDDLVRVNQDGCSPGKEATRRRGCVEPAPDVHSVGLRALLAGLKRERLRRGLSLSDVARMTDQARSAISRLESGRYSNPTLDTVFRYASALGVKITLSAERLTIKEEELEFPGPD
jgi:DNA-binding XRE family transcriptional regulator